VAAPAGSKPFTLRGDPFERADEEGIGYDTWRFERVFAVVLAQAFVAKWLHSFRDLRRPRPSASTRSWTSSPPVAPAATERKNADGRDLLPQGSRVDPRRPWWEGPKP
jgi:hypothetical protein